MKVKIQDNFHNWKNESVYGPLMIEYTKKRAENLGQRPEEPTHLECGCKRLRLIILIDDTNQWDW